MIIRLGSKIKDDEGRLYLLTEELGHGGFGCVYKAIRDNDGAVFAVKTLLYSFGNEDSVESFINEIHLSSKVSGENVINYIYAHDGEKYPELPPYIIMEYADGGSLKDILEGRKRSKDYFAKEELLDMYKQLISGMRDINEKLVHRDIKPDNILISNGKLKVTDFGLAKIASESTRTMSFKGYGTIHYIAPEAWKTEKNTIQMDIYSMGIVFYEMATLEYPYQIVTNEIEEYKNAHLFSRVCNLTLLQNVVGNDVASVIMTMLEKPIKKRFESWSDIWQKIDSPLSASEDAMDNIVSLAIGKKIETDTKNQQRIEEENRQRKEKEEFINSVRLQYMSEIIDCIERFSIQYNEHLSGVDKCRFSEKIGYRTDGQYTHVLSIPSVTDINIRCKVIFPNSETRIVDIDKAYGYSPLYGRYGKREMTYTPKYKNRDIKGWVEISNSKRLGFNLWLVSSDDIYGEWFILQNKNNGILMTQYEPKVEPFAFEIDELDEALKGISAFSIYSSNVSEFTEKMFLERLAELIE